MKRSFVRKFRQFGVAYAIGILSATRASAGFFDEKIVKACPQAELEKQRFLLKRPQQPKPVANITRPALQNELLQIARDTTQVGLNPVRAS
jgi:hypothetical protein